MRRQPLPGGPDGTTSAGLADVQAERMPGRVEQDPDVVLRLIVGECGALLERPGDALVQVGDRDVEMPGDVLLTGHARPDRPGVLSLVFEVQRGPDFTCRRT